MADFKTIIKTINDFSDGHTQINYFDWGNIYEIDSNKFNFITLFVNPKPAVIKNDITYFNFDIYILDLMEQDESNLLDVMNLTSMIGNDMINEFLSIEYEEEFEIDENNIKITPFVGKFDHLLGGWIYNIDFMIDIKDCYK